MKTVRVLVIDDSLTIRGILEAMLEQHADIEIIGLAGDVEEAREAMKQRQPNVITLDLALPDTDGMEFLAELVRQPHAPVVVLSSSTTQGSAKTKEALKIGAYACFDKARLVQDSARLLKAMRKAAEKGLAASVPAQEPESQVANSV